MKKTIIIFLFAVLVAAAGILYYTPGGEFETKSVEAEGAKMISIENFAFNPSEISVAKGAEIVWVNNDKVLHDITLDNGAFDKDLQPSESFSFIFNEAGEYSYHCDIHPEMIGKIIVE